MNVVTWTPSRRVGYVAASRRPGRAGTSHQCACYHVRAGALVPSVSCGCVRRAAGTLWLSCPFVTYLECGGVHECSRHSQHLLTITLLITSAWLTDSRIRFTRTNSAMTEYRPVRTSRFALWLYSALSITAVGPTVYHFRCGHFYSLLYRAECVVNSTDKDE